MSLNTTGNSNSSVNTSLNTSVPTSINDTYAVPSLPLENIANKEDKANKGVANGYAPLDATSKVPSANLPVIDVSGQIATHNSATTSVHGIANTANLVLTSDSRLADSRQPTAHTHTKSEITDFTHAHAISDVTNLQTTLDTKFQTNVVVQDVTINNHFTPYTIPSARLSAFRISLGTEANSVDVRLPATANVGDKVFILIGFLGFTQGIGKGVEVQSQQLAGYPPSLQWVQIKHWQANTANGGYINQKVCFEYDGTTWGTALDWTAFRSPTPVLIGAVATSDPRLTDSRTPTTHTHGNITNAGAVGTTANLPLITTTSGVVTTGTFGTTPNSFCQGDDSRLSDNRTPTTHTHDDRYYTETEIDTKLSGLPVGGHTHDERYYTETEMDTLLNGKQASGSYAPSTGIAPSAITGTAVVTNDSRLSDPRTPTAHKSSHATGGTDALTPLDIGASATIHAHGNIVSGGAVPTRDGQKTITLISAGAGYSSGSAFINGIAVGISATSGGMGAGGAITSVTAVGSFSAVGAGTYAIFQNGNSTASVRLDSVFAENLPLITTTNGVITTGSFGTTANTFCQGNDSRFSDLSSMVRLSPVASYANLPSPAVSGYVYLVQDTQKLYGWDALANGGEYREIAFDNGGTRNSEQGVIPDANGVLNLTARQALNRTIVFEPVSAYPSITINLPTPPPSSINISTTSVAYPWDGATCTIKFRGDGVTASLTTPSTLIINSGVYKNERRPYSEAVYFSNPTGQRATLFSKTHTGFFYNLNITFIVIYGEWYPIDGITNIGSYNIKKSGVDALSPRTLQSTSVATRTILRPDPNGVNQHANDGFCYFFPQMLTYNGNAFTEPASNISAQRNTADSIVQSPQMVNGSCYFNMPSYVRALKLYHYTAVNFSGYPLSYSHGNHESNNAVMRLGAGSFDTTQAPFPDSTNPKKTRIAFSFALTESASFSLGILTDSVGDSQYTPEKIIVAIFDREQTSLFSSTGSWSSVLYGAQHTERMLNLASRQVTADGNPKVIPFGITAKAGSTIAVFLSNEGTNKRYATISALYWGDY